MSTTDLVAELRSASWGDGLSYVHDLMGTAAAEIERLRQGLWDCARLAGADLDGDDTPEHLTKPDIVAFTHRAVLELAGDYDLALMEITSLYQESDWHNFTENGKVAPLGEDADDEVGRGC